MRATANWTFHAPRAIGPLAALALLAACGSAPPDTTSSGIAPCPRIAILADGADLTRFHAGATRDLTALVADAKIAGFEASCDYTGRDRRALDIRITPRFEAERGPAAEGRVLDLPWFVAMTSPNDAEILDRQGFVARVTFGPNAARANITARPVRLSLPLEAGVRAADYTVRISFQLTPEELALNRARGPR